MDPIDEEIAIVQGRLDMLRNKDYVPERERRIYYRAIADNEMRLRDLLEQKESKIGNAQISEQL
jgi:hypothetical protein